MIHKADLKKLDYLKNSVEFPFISIRGNMEGRSSTEMKDNSQLEKTLQFI